MIVFVKFSRILFMVNLDMLVMFAGIPLNHEGRDIKATLALKVDA